MMRFTSVVLPAPVGPTIATVWPGSATSDKSLDQRLRRGRSENVTCSNATRPWTSGDRSGSRGVGALLVGVEELEDPLERRDARLEDVHHRRHLGERHGENWREYWMNAWMSPSGSCPQATRSPPTTATMTYWMLPMNIVAGCMRPDMNCAPNLDSYSSSLCSRNPARPRAGGRTPSRRVAGERLLDLGVELPGVPPLRR